MKRVILLFGLLMITSQFLSAQDFETNLEKYWSYRDRLTTDFMIIGDDAGKSLPALWRNDTLRHLGWSDNTTWQGWYITNLALEYHLLTNNYPGYADGRPNALDETIEELTLALKAVVRLDEIAENGYFPASCDTLGLIRNGFFVRDDVPAGFEPFFPGIDLVRGSYNSANIFLKEMSQDQAYYLLMGMAMVAELIPDTLQYNGFSLRQEAITEAKLILEWVHQEDWIIKSPVCYDGGQLKPVMRGENASFFAKGVNDLCKHFTGGTPNFDADVNVVAQFTWPTLSSPANPSFSNIDNKHMVCAISTVGRAYADSTFSVLMDLAEADRWYAWPLMHAVLHDTLDMDEYPTLKPTMNFWADSMMNEAPETFPYSTWPDPNTHGYSAINRFMRTLDEQYLGTSINENRSFNGLDFMTLYNLYYVANYDQWPRPVGVEELTEAHTVSIYPNPASEYIRIELEGNEGEVQLEMVDITGRVVLRDEFNGNRHTLLLSASITSGVYMIRVQGKEIFRIDRMVIW